MDIIVQMVTSFVAAAGFGILFNAPRGKIATCGLVGMAGWMLYDGLVFQGLELMPATVIAAVLVGVLSRFAAKWHKTPVIIFNVSGIIPLVPGGVAYDAMRHFVEADYLSGVQLSVQVMLLAGGIAMGLMFSEVASQITRKIQPAEPQRGYVFSLMRGFRLRFFCCQELGS
ncbi:UPF0442 protein [Lentibacillus sp. JNUCC-1]|nr:UPF0442 protein [Lentibacillus sp. JNUCC-1]